MSATLAKENKAIAKAEKKERIYSKRIWEIDFLRGIIIIGMIIEHFLSNFCNIFNMIFDFSGSPIQPGIQALIDFSNTWLLLYPRQAIRVTGIVLLLVLTGISSHFSKKNISRSFIIIGIGVIYGLFLFFFSLATGNKQYAVFPIIACLGVCILLYNLIRKGYLYILYKKNIISKEDNYHKSWKWVSLALAFVIFILAMIMKLNTYFATVKDASIGDAMAHIWVLFNEYYPAVINNTDLEMNFVNYLRVVIGDVPYGCDVLGLLPSIGYVFLGGFIGETIYLSKKSAFHYFMKKKHKDTPEKEIYQKADKINYKCNKTTRAINFPGRHSTLFYIAHQPALILTVGIILIIFGARFK